LSFDFANDGNLLIVSSAAGQLLKQDLHGKITVFAEMKKSRWNEIVADGRGNVYVNGPSLLRVGPDGRVSHEAEDFAFPTLRT